MTEDHSVTALLARWRQGDEAALSALVEIVYTNLRNIAARHISRERAGFTLSATEVVHEAYQRLQGADVSWQDRAHFLAIASRQMRQVLVDHARTKGRQKRGGDNWQRVTLSEVGEAAGDSQIDILSIQEVLERLATFDSRKAQIVDFMVFGGLSGREIGEVLAMPEHIVWREWRMARAWLHSELKLTRSE